MRLVALLSAVSLSFSGFVFSTVADGGFGGGVVNKESKKMILNISVYGAKKTAGARISAEFKSAAKENIEGYDGVYLQVNGVRCSRDDEYLLVPFGRLHVGYNFKADIDDSATAVEFVLAKNNGGGYKRIISIESFGISGFPESVDSSRDLVLTYDGPDFEGRDSLLVVAGKVGELARPLGEWSDLTGNRLATSPGQIVISSSKLKELSKGDIQFTFYRSSKRKFDEENMAVEVVQFSSPVYRVIDVE